MNDVTSMSSLTAKMLLATAFIDGHIDDKESKQMADIISKFEDVSVEEQMKIVDGFKELGSVEAIIEHISPEISAIAEAADENFKRALLLSMSLVGMADGEEHTHEVALIKTCADVWGIKFD
jgi:uncharacterized tellurite resistance protein B-like protein